MTVTDRAKASIDRDLAIHHSNPPFASDVSSHIISLPNSPNLDIGLLLKAPSTIALPDDTISVLHAHLEYLIAIPASFQKLLYKAAHCVGTP